jgi:cell division protein FtsN
MAKNYPRKRGAPQRSCGFFKHLFLVLVSFVAGYAFATCCDYTKVMQWVNDYVLKPRQPTPIEKPIQEAELPKPKFEFYTLLTKESNRPAVAPVASSPTAAAAIERDQLTASVPARPQPQLSIETNLPIDDASLANQPVQVSDERALQKIGQLPQVTSSPASSKDNYLVQLASFRRPQDADKMKASLTMKGYIASVVAVNQKNIYWYRVVLGPFANKSDAQRAQQTVARSERITGMVRKLDT